MKKKISVTAATRRVSKHLFAATLMALAPHASAATFTVTDFTDGAAGGLAGTGPGSAGDLRSAILAANAAGGSNAIAFACGAPPCTITLQGPLPPIMSDLAINGAGNVIVDGAGSYRAFFIDTGTVALSNLTIRNASAKGGAGGNVGGNGGGGGGGGAGLGAAVFVNQAGANVAITNVSFSANSAVGGNGGGGGNNAWAGGGGGGMAFAGGTSTANGGGAGGGGILGPGASIGTTSGGAGGAGGGGGGGAFGGSPGAGGNAYAGNTAGASGVTSTAGAGGFGGGGGGSATGVAATGGFGGGGGGNGSGAAGAVGGPGGGGGGSGGGSGPAAGGSLGAGVSGGLGRRGGGGGAAAGPDVFVRLGTLTTSNSTTASSCATGGSAGTHATAALGGAPGSADGTPVFNFGGTVNGATTVGPVETALTATATRSITYSATTLRESIANDGTVPGTLTLTLANETFSGNNGDDFVAAGKVAVSNVPAGLTAVVTRTSATTATLTLTGTATSADAANSIANLTVAFTNSAFTCSTAASVTGASRNDLAVTFADADLEVAIAGPATALPGANLTYIVNIRSNGGANARAPAWTDTLPAGTTFVSLTQTSGAPFTCTTPAVGGTGSISCTRATLTAGFAGDFSLVLQAGAGTGGTTITNTVAGSMTDFDPNTADNTSSVSTAITAPSADLGVTLSAPASVTAGGNITYNSTVVNNGPIGASSVVLGDVLPAGTTFVSLAQTSGIPFTCTTPAVGAGGTVSCSLPSLASGATATFALTVATAAGAASAVTNTATISSATVDANAANNSASATTSLGASQADLGVTLTGPASVAPGANVAYTVTVSNAGPGPAQAAAWTDALPAGTTFVSLSQASGSAFACTVPAVGANGSVSCSIATLASGTNAVFNLVAKAAATSAGTTIVNIVAASTASADPASANNSASVSTLSSSRTYTGASPTGGGNITASFSGGGASCSFSTAQFIPLTGAPRSPPAGSAPADIAFPYGLFDFTTTGCTPGATLAFTITYPSTLAPATSYYKYGPTASQVSPHWYILSSTVSGNTVSFSITDGGLGDDDMAANGTVVDQGGPGVPASTVAQVPTLSEWAMIVLAMMMLAGGALGIRRNER